MADAAVGFLLEKLTHLLVYNAELIGNSKHQVEGLLEDLKLFKAFIRDSAEKRSSNRTLQALVENIRSVVDKADYAIDKFVVQKAIFRSRNAIGRAIHGIDHYITIRNISKEIESIKNEVSDIYTKKLFGFQALQLGELPDKGATQRKPPTVEEDDVVGFEEETKTVIERLIGEDMDLEIITIIGMPGLGKTTLAKKIYNDPIIEYEFFIRAWVLVSQTYSRREIFLSILRIFTQTTFLLHESDEVIAAKLCQCLEEGKYLIVMDDVWTKEAWDDLKIAFPNKKNGSRILITCRHNQVARHANPTKDPHNLKFLSTEESWELLEKKVFGKEKCPTGELQSLGELIIARCERLPLAIVVIAGILLNNRKSSDWWNQVAQDVGSFSVTDQEKLLALGYNYLPYHLKSCFLYLGVFPQDYEIPVWKLIRLWIAEGFVEQNEWQQSLEDIAKAWVEDLVNRNLLMRTRRSFNGQIKTCHVHDMLHDFCKKEAQKQKLYQEIKVSNMVTHDKYRLVCIHSGLEKYISSKPTGKYVHSFLCFTSEEFILPSEHVSTIPKGFELLRVLEIRSINFDVFPEDLLLLVLLRYVALSFTQKVNVIPAKISSLGNMQTMIILTRSRTLEVKGELWKMYQLRHLYTNASAILPAPPSNSPESGENVQSLSMISPESCNKQVLSRTPNIRKLGVRGKIAVLFDQFFDNVGELKYLTNLKLFNDIFLNPPSTSKIPRFSAADKFPTNLQKLTLSETSLDWQDMHILETFGKLEVLKLKDNAFKGQIWETRNGGFKSLKFLHIGRTDLVTWIASEDHFPSLVRLVLHHCDRLGTVPIALADVDSFHDLELHRTSKSAAASARKIQFRKMAKGQATKTSGGFKVNIYPPDT